MIDVEPVEETPRPTPRPKRSTAPRKPLSEFVTGAYIVRVFAPPPRAPEALLANASLLLMKGPLRGLTLAGFGVWQSQREDDALGVTLPTITRPHGVSWRRYGLVRADTKQGWKSVRQLREDILEAYRQAGTLLTARPRHSPKPRPSRRRSGPSEADALSISERRQRTADILNGLRQSRRGQASPPER